MSIQQTVSCLDGYDPDALRVDKAREAILACLTPIAQAETVSIRDALGRVLAEDIVSSLQVPAHDNAAMDGFAARGRLREFDRRFLDETLGKPDRNERIGGAAWLARWIELHDKLR